MCYPKPGPRCSAHAAARVARAQQAALIYLNTHEGVADHNWDGFEKLRRTLDRARAEYDITPAGIKALERLVAQSPESTSHQFNLERAISERAARLDALTVDRRVEIKHRQPKKQGAPTYSNHDLAADGAHLSAFGFDHPDVTTLLDASVTWSQRLTSEEIETCRWYSMGGYEAINSHLVNPSRAAVARARDNLGDDALPHAVAQLDSAIAKATSDTPTIVYRRHFFYTPAGDITTLTLAQQRAQFPVGSIYRPNFYMSTSLDPDNAQQGDIVAALQIKTRRGAPLPAIANQGVQEQEVLLPRDGAYHVIANDRQVTITDRRGEQRTINIIQLEEVDATN